jgi:hypothetical protein
VPSLSGAAMLCPDHRDRQGLLGRGIRALP